VPLEIDATGRHILHLFLGIERDILLREHARLVASRSLGVKVSADRPPRSLLTRREQDVLEHLAQDEDPRRVAAILCRSPATVRNHVRHILKKLGAHSIDEAVAMHLLYDPMP
jgi:DNA-binding CsgD family transcriptional regulator